ncbi:MAG: potassium/proton antiporter [Synergistaceae bacterium]|nr:potassium/proton antiporter [Synergistaceae bacterium]
MESATHLVLFVSVLLLFCIAFSRFLSKVGIPVLVFFILAGMLMGSDGVGGIYFDDAAAASVIGNFAICYILFAGGMATKWKSVRPVLLPGALLATVGVLMTALFVGVLAHFLVGLPWLQGLLLGSVVSCTDAASVFSILRSKNMNLKGDLAPLLELESSSNDPTAYMLTISVVSLMQTPESGMLRFAEIFLLQFAIGALLGYLFGHIGARLMNRMTLNSDGMYPVVAVTLAALIYTAIQTLHGNGFLGIYIAGVVMGNVKLVQKGVLVRFFDGLSWLMQILVFVTLGLLVFPSQLPSVWLPAMAVSLLLMFVIRPAAVFLTLHPFNYSTKAKLLVSWVGFRGASSIVFATYALTYDLPQGNVIFNMVFFISLTSVILQGSMLAPLAAMLNQLDNDASAPVARSITDFDDEMQGNFYELTAGDGSKAVGLTVRDLNFPGGVRIVLIRRGEAMLTPGGETKVEAGDVFMVSCDDPLKLPEIKERLSLA